MSKVESDVLAARCYRLMLISVDPDDLSRIRARLKIAVADSIFSISLSTLRISLNAATKLKIKESRDTVCWLTSMRVNEQLIVEAKG